MKLFDPFAPFSMYFDREGRPIDRARSVLDRELDLEGLLKWQAMIASSYRDVAFTEVGRRHVCTSWIGLDMNIFGPPLMFETMVFNTAHRASDTLVKSRDPWDLYRDRYGTESAALAGHMRIVNLVRRFPAGPPEVDPELVPSPADENQN